MKRILAGLLAALIVLTCFGCVAEIMTDPALPSGSDRIAAALKGIEAAI